MSNAAPQPPTFAPRTVRCPACGGDSRYASDNPYRPFCSARCKNMDLGAWASGDFRVAAGPDADAAGLDAASY